MNPFVRIGLVLWMAAAYECAIASTQAEVIEIDPSQRFQTIEGFGASGAWWAQSVGAWPKDKREPILKLLYDSQDGIGLTIYRYNIGAGSGDDISIPVEIDVARCNRNVAQESGIKGIKTVQF